MIASLRGVIQSAESDCMVVEVSGVGYQVFVMNTVLQQFHQGNSIFLYTYQAVREDGIFLYGFLERMEKELFLLLQNVSGIGPKASMNILNHTSPEDFIQAVLEEDLSFLVGLPGVGKKTAQRFIIELKDKVEWPALGKANRWEPSDSKLHPEFLPDVADALSALGYSEKEVRETLKQLQQEATTETNVQAWVKAALRKMAT
ncbi:Holliday junction branch migration protein RuvA [Fodinisporobacter ferrooxydans]|uniref:Holliday junction branch migration complex subunit RuvA n=1 Tax=Fodinisporobacter ferrooxydans TaxID=2901836 RepID=A0ABY4CQF2_9BACL|nr:Holliday junction branch migration protein RuvA [Alicyclobacillaceae bacterium MYW30-H2]